MVPNENNVPTYSLLEEKNFHLPLMELQSPTRGVNLTSFLPWINILRESSSTTHAIYFSMSDIKYKGRFNELLERSHPLGFPETELAMIAFDEETYSIFTSANVSTFRMDDDRIPIGKRVMRAKFMGTLALLLAGYEVYFGEMDIYWRDIPEPSFFSTTNEFVVSQHKSGSEINIGFYYCRPTPQMIETMERLVWFLESPGHTETQRKITFDQKLFDLAVRGPVSTQQLSYGRFSNILNESEKDYLKPPNETYLNWEYLPSEVLEHWPIRDLDADKLAGVHIWSGMGNPEKQITWALRCFVDTDRENRPSDC